MKNMEDEADSRKVRQGKLGANCSVTLANDVEIVPAKIYFLLQDISGLIAPVYSNEKSESQSIVLREIFNTNFLTSVGCCTVLKRGLRTSCIGNMEIWPLQNIVAATLQL